jgi:hypothetical protein
LNVDKSGGTYVVVHVDGVRLCLWTAPPTGLLFIPDVKCMECHAGTILKDENRRTQRKSCPSATSSTKNWTWTDPGAPSVNRGLLGERLATSRISHVTPLYRTYSLPTDIFSSRM